MLSPACASHSHSVHVTVRERACVFFFHFFFQLPERTGNWFFNGQSVVTVISGRKRKEEKRKEEHNNSAAGVAGNIALACRLLRDCVYMCRETVAHATFSPNVG